MGGFLAGIFGSAHDDIPLEERDILRVASRGFWQGADGLPGKYDSRAVNFQTLLDTGHMPYVKELDWNDQYIDWSSDDAYTRAITEVRENTMERIKQDPDLQNLLAKDSWSRDDRVTWERSVSTIVNEEHLKIPGLSEYRNDIQQEYPTVERRATRLNDLSLDIENNTKTIEHDCESMSIFEGVILQQIDNEMLPNSSPDGDLKESANYFYVIGRSNFSVGLSGRDYGHAWIVSSATTNVIDGAATAASYLENTNPEATFEDFVRGDTFYGEDGSIYAAYENQFDDITRMRIESGDIDYAKIYEAIPLRSEITQKTFDDAPPEAQSLIELKTRIAALEEMTLDENGIQTEPARMSAYRSRFDHALDEMVEDDGIYEVIAYNPWRRDTLTALSVGEDEKFEIAAEWVKEMNPGWESARVNTYVQERIAYKIPELDSGEYEDYAAFREATIQSKMENEFPGIDFDEAEAFYFSEEGVKTAERYYDMLRTGAMDQDLMSDPQVQMVRAFFSVNADMNLNFPWPGSIEAHAKEVDNLRDLQAEYNEFKQREPDLQLNDNTLNRATPQI